MIEAILKRFAVLALLLVLCIGTLGFFQATHQTNQPSNSTQRYALIVLPDALAIFLLDTQTGKIWKREKYTDALGQPVIWMPEDRLNTPEEVSKWFSIQKVQEPHK